MHGRGQFGWVVLTLVGVYWLFYAVFFGGALLFLVNTSFHVYEWGQPTTGLSSANFAAVIEAGPFLPALAKSALVSTVIAITCAAIGLLTVIGAFSARSGLIRVFILVCCALMFFAGGIPRTFAAQFLLSGNGPLGALSMGGPRPEGLLYSLAGVLLGYLPLMLPPAVLALYVARDAVPNEMIDAASDLGAGWWTQQARVVVPLMRPGLIVAILFPFVLTLADVIVVDLVGGARVYTAAMVILDFVKVDDWGRAAAASVLLLSLALGALAAGTWTLETRVKE